MSSPGRSHAVFPGTFDPFTLGHLDLLHRARGLFEHVTVAVARHHAKHALLEPEERVELVRRCVRHLEDVEVIALENLLVEGCRAIGATVVVRGVRSAADLEYERSMALTNRALAPEIETVLLLPAAEVSHVSSTIVRQLARMGADVTGFVPGEVADVLHRRFRSPASP